MDWGLVSSLALMGAGAAVVGHGVVCLVTARTTFRRAADSWLIGVGAVVVGATPGGSGVLTTTLRVGGLVLVLSGTLLMMRDREQGDSPGR